MIRKSLPLFFLLSILLTACGTMAHAASNSTQTNTLPDTLEVTSLSRPTAFHKTITDPTSVQNLYKSLYALPHAPQPTTLPHTGPGPVSFAYRLQFFAHSHLLKQVVLQTISFHGLALAPHDYRQVTAQFWSTLAQTLQVPRDTFFQP
jgi:hypothetical protein